MKIYFSCSITGGRADEQIYQVLVADMLAQGHKVPTAHLSNSNVLELEKVACPAEIFDRDMKWLNESDLVVAEVTTPSHGVGYEIAVGILTGKPVFCCYRQGKKVSMILSGNRAGNLTLASYTDSDDAVEKLRYFLKSQEKKSLH
jgi:2'-deoxynucleoside 5'-phosphate N-hydrolase